MVTFIRDFIASAPVNAKAIEAAFTAKSEKAQQSAKKRVLKALNARLGKATGKYQKADKPDEKKALETVRAPLLPLPLLCPLR